MKKLRGLSLALFVAVLLGALNLSAYAAENTVKAYITVSYYGEIAKDKYGDFVAESEITLSGKESYTLDDAFKKAHELYYIDGEAGYASLVDDTYGAYVVKAWGNTSGNFGYQMNGGTVSVWSLAQTVNNGDYIDLAIYQNTYPETESYTVFNSYETYTNGSSVALALSESYYGENWETLFRPCADATILVNGKECGAVTDSNGLCLINLEKGDKYVISAKKTKEITNALTDEKVTVAAITAPVCVVTVSETNNIFTCGDVNGDGAVTAKDVTIMARHVAKWDGYEILPIIAN